MACKSTVRVVSYLVATALAGVSAAAFPSLARADAGSDAALAGLGLATAPAVDVGSALDGATAGALVEKISAALDTTAAAVDGATEAPPPEAVGAAARAEGGRKRRYQW
jgi:hypothetical protein